jgi:hypothetical protein
VPPKTLGGHGHLYVKASRTAGVNQYAKLNVDDIITTPQDARDTVRAYSELGFGRLADAVL